jgi:hypothetical protein
MLKRLFGMIFAFLVCLPFVSAQSPSVTQVFTPGDTLHFVIRFDGPADFASMTLRFEMTTPKKPEQKDFVSQLDFQQLSKLSPNEIEVAGTVPNNIATGTFKAMYIYSNHGQLSHSYTLDPSMQVTIEVRNTGQYHFPGIHSITQKP